MQLVGDLMSRYNPTMTTPRFKIMLPPQQVFDLLTQFYIIEVKRRHVEMEIDETTEANLNAVTDAITAEVPKFGIWLYGAPGNGKTTMMFAFMRLVDFLNSQRHFSFMGEYFHAKPRFKVAKDIVEIAKETPREFSDLFDESILCIDDLGTEPKELQDFGNIKTPMMDLLMYRYRLQSFTFVTSNLSPKQIKEKYDERVADRCREMFETIKFIAPTYRKK